LNCCPNTADHRFCYGMRNLWSAAHVRFLWPCSTPLRFVNGTVVPQKARVFYWILPTLPSVLPCAFMPCCLMKQNDGNNTSHSNANCQFFLWVEFCIARLCVSNATKYISNACRNFLFGKRWVYMALCLLSICGPVTKHGPLFLWLSA
jgi:hypothetical protein